MSLEGLKLMTDSEKKSVMLEILVKIDALFSENNIEYFLADGTLIGAIRHKGFIPWDDDIDLLVPRDSFIKLIHLMVNKKEDLAKNNIEILEYGVNKKDYYKRFKIADTRTVMEEFGEVRSAVFVDIFPLDFLKTNSLKKAKKLRKKILKLDNLCSLCNAGVAQGAGLKRKIYKLLLCMFKCFGLNRVKSSYERKILKLTTHSRMGIACASETGLGDRDFSNAECWAQAIKVEFEGALYNVPVGYHQVLTGEYGDYMQLPPENERYSHEYYKMYWKQ